MVDTALIVKGAGAFGVSLRLGDDDTLVYDARHEPSEAILARIGEHKEAIVALLKTRQAVATIKWDKLTDLDVDGYAALISSVKDDIAALQASVDRLERAAAAILPRMREHACSWNAAIEGLLAENYNVKYARRRPKGVSDPEWLAALYAARLLEQRGPQPHRGVIK
jgi:hypothetical protein